MTHNVGSTERYARLAAGAVAGAAAMRTTGWQRTALGLVAAAGVGTALTRYCPMNQAIGRGMDDAPLDQGRRDAELRRQTAMAGSLGSTPSMASSSPRVTADGDVFGMSER